jgi:hypothetical protein
MNIQTIIFILFGAVALWMLLNPLTKKKDIVIPPLKPFPTPEETNRIEPVEPEPTPPAEMPIKPIPVNCQKAMFKPFPEKYRYVDCCGDFQIGDGYQEWEKRAPVSIDANRPFEGMELINEEGVPCE